VHLDSYHYLQEFRGIENGTYCKLEIAAKRAVFLLLYKHMCPNHAAKQMPN